MNSSPVKHVTLPEDTHLTRKLSDMSPVTDLAMNLKSLKTTLTATPTRRISWSDPFKNINATKCPDGSSPSVDSPMLQEILKKNVKRSKTTLSKKMLDVGDEKENIPPEKSVLFRSMESSSSESTVDDSQDSGYCGTSKKQFISETCGSTPRLKVRSSLFSNTNVQDLDGLFSMDCDSNIENTLDLNVESLLTKPLCNIVDDSIERNTSIKTSTRRCLTMEMECSNDSSSMDLDFSYNNVRMPPIIEQSNSTDILLFRRLPFKRPDPSEVLTWQNKRRKSSPSVNFLVDDEDKTNFIKQRSFSETAATIMQAVQKADLQPDLIGDCSRYYALPLVKGRHQDLKCISSETLVQVLRGEFNQKIDGYTLIDCRYPYEFEGGHIKGANNIYTKEEIMGKFLENVPEPNDRNIIIFHCEFSSERAPNLCRFLRNKDREMNECNYPKLHHPEIYLLEGGYKTFFASFQDYCEPRDYKPMNHKDHSSDLKIFRAKSKSWGTDSKSRYKKKSAQENDDI